MTDTIEQYRGKVAGTNIDPRTLLSTDYFNTFNSVVMLLDMLPDSPDLLDEIDQWVFHDYIGHFKKSGLDFADLAIDAYAHVPPETRERFEKKINGMRIFVEESRRMLRLLLEAGEQQTFTRCCHMLGDLFRGMMEEGSGIVHGTQGVLDQSSIDRMF